MKLWASNVPNQHFPFPDGSGVTGISRQIRERDLPEEELVSRTFTDGVGPERKKKKKSPAAIDFVFVLIVSWHQHNFDPSLPARGWADCRPVYGIYWGSRTEGPPTEFSTTFQPAPSPASASFKSRKTPGGKIKSGVSVENGSQISDLLKGQ